MSIPSTQTAWHLPEVSQRNSPSALRQVKDAKVKQPGPGEVLIKVHAVSLNYRDFMVATGRYPSRVVKHANLIPTSDGAGEVAAVDYLSYEEASTLPCAALTAYNALFGLAGTPLKAGETAVLEGTGGVSVFGAQIALAAGAVAVITSSSDEKLAIVKKSIPQEHQSRLHLHNYSKDPDWAKAAKSVSGGIGAARVLDVGGSGTIIKAFESVRPGGVVSAIGIIAKGSAEGDLGSLIRNSRGIYAGIIVGSRELFEEMNRLFEAHQIKPLIDRVFPFDQAVQAYQHLESQKHVGKIVIKVA
ncbi:Zinc-binding oxidoreductase [Ceraceosorus bombacis]|uniref:Zinc-binding oxidoreductase n=1 Tax=Ceraceosorus bombacis TaxID=401625 RepID=A0A0P1B9R8_9BASI|nr:Zinc-binding oxidoreductase [Ceraceosorus bombacis]